MSEVRMSLQEYNEIKEKMDRQERILHAILNPSMLSEWEINYHKEHPDNTIGLSCSPLENLSDDDREYLISLVDKNVASLTEKLFLDHDIAMMFEKSLSIHIGYLRNVRQEVESND